METAQPVAVGDLIGGYRLDKPLGAGAVSKVFRATHLKLGRQVAIKVLTGPGAEDARTIQRFLAEARVVNDIRHPNIVDIADFLEGEGGRLALVMELIEGPSLKKLRVEGRRLSFVQALGVILQLGDALTATHAIGVIHRDLKPDNLLLTEEPPPDTHLVPWLKVVDFGIAKISGANVERTATGVMIGTPAYMAPEQIAGRPGPSPATDVYAVGELLYEVLTGERAFPQGQINETVAAKLRGYVPPSDRLDVPGGVAIYELVLRSLEQRPEKRPSLAEIRSRLIEICPEAERYAYRPGPISQRPDLEVITVEPPMTVSNSRVAIPAAETAPLGTVNPRVDSTKPGHVESDAPEAVGTALTRLASPPPRTSIIPPVDEEKGTPFDDKTTSVGMASSAQRSLAGEKKSPVGAVLIAAVLGAGASWLALGSRHAEVEPPAVLPLAAAKAQVESVPAGAQVEDADSGAVLGQTPLGFELLGHTPRRIRISHTGYDSVVVRVSPEQPKVAVELTPRLPLAPEPTPVAVPPPAREAPLKTRSKNAEGTPAARVDGGSGDFPTW